MGAIWNLPIAKTTALGSGVKPGAIALTVTRNLLTVDAPTKMVPWDLTAIRVPVTVGVNVKVEPAAGAEEATLVMTLRRGGDVVWTTTLKEAMQLNAAKEWLLNTSMGAEFLNPIELPTGKALTLELTVAFRGEAEANGAALGFGAQQTAVNVFQFVEGSVTYATEPVSGHRVLS